jgi:hypothetical protein
MKKYFVIINFCLLVLSEGTVLGQDWKVSVLPSSVRLNPQTNEIIDIYDNCESCRKNLLEKNWVYDGNKVSLRGARGEYVSFQVVLTRNTDAVLKGISVDVPPFKGTGGTLRNPAELFLEWSVEVKTPSTGYPKASLGKGWYPDALIPFHCVQAGPKSPGGSWIYPLQLPDFNNRIENQKSQIIWVDQYIPFSPEDAKAGSYSTSVSITIDGMTQAIPVVLDVWDFAISNENNLKGSLQQEGFLKNMDDQQELEVYQLFKRNRVALMDPTYDPKLTMTKAGAVALDWEAFDQRLKKYFTGEAFTEKYGYRNGPGYGEPIETFLLPFDVYGKLGTPGWPDIGTPDVERQPEKREIYIKTIQAVRDHVNAMLDPKKTELFAYLNGLDESYFPEAYSRMVYYGDIFKKYYPEAQFRVDGGYDDDAIKIIGHSIDAWATHTINYDSDKMRKYQNMGIKDWIYGPMLYESKVNSWVGSSTFIDLPLVNDRAISWSTWKYKARSWISWGIGAGWRSAWYDPETWKSANDGGNATYSYKKLNGNALLIYSPGIVPNVDEVCPSIRLKTMRDGVEEYESMRMLSQLAADASTTSDIVNKIIDQPFGRKSIGNLNVWSFDAEKWDNARTEIGERIDQLKKGGK